MPGRILAQIARKRGAGVLGRVIDKALPTDPLAGKPTLVGGLVGALAVRFATRSVPGAIIVGGGLLAKTLYDRRRAKRPAGSKAPPKA